MVDKYNSTYHRSIKLTPSDARNPSNYQHVYNALYGNVRKATLPKFHVGDKVCITRKKGTFEKGFTPNWTEKLFTINSAKATNPTTCTFKEQLGKPVRGSFYEQEMQLSVHEIFRIERVIRRKIKNTSSFNLAGQTIITCIYLERGFASKSTRSSGKASRVD